MASRRPVDADRECCESDHRLSDSRQGARDTVTVSLCWRLSEFVLDHLEPAAAVGNGFACVVVFGSQR